MLVLLIVIIDNYDDNDDDMLQERKVLNKKRKHDENKLPFGCRTTKTDPMAGKLTWSKVCIYITYVCSFYRLLF